MAEEQDRCESVNVSSATVPVVVVIVVVVDLHSIRQWTIIVQY